MITSQEASKIVQDIIQGNLILSEETIDLIDSQHRILAENVLATCDQPPFDRVTMDGIAINFESLVNNSNFTIEGVQAAGQEAKTLSLRGNCLEVMTGAPLPIGCDTVIPYEVVEVQNNSAIVLNPKDITCGQNIHTTGSDYKKGTLLITKGTVIHSRNLSLIASTGTRTLKVKKNPKIAIISTGDELIEPGQEILPHQIFKSNPFALNALFLEHHFPVVTIAHLPDDYEKMLIEIKKILSLHEVVVLTGGVSKGKFDFLPAVLGDLGVKTLFHQVTQRPGKPLFFGLGVLNQLIFGLPGNPVSCLVNLRKYVLCGLKNNFNPSMTVKITSKIILKNKMTFFLPAKLEFSNDGLVLAMPIYGNGSGDFYSLRDSDGFIEIDNLHNTNVFSEGTTLPFYHWNF